MLVSGVLFALFLVACWLYCLIDAALTPVAAFRGLPKAAWISIIAATFAVGAVAWLALSRRRLRASPWPAADRPAEPHVMPSHTYVYWQPDWAAAEASLSRHPAGRSRKTPIDGCARPKGPDDDLEFIRTLERRIRDTRRDSGA